MHAYNPYAVRILVVKQPESCVIPREASNPTGVEVTVVLDDGMRRSIGGYRYLPSDALTTKEDIMTVLYGVLRAHMCTVGDGHLDGLFDGCLTVLALCRNLVCLSV